MTNITSSLLRSRGACAGQVELFVSLGGDEKPLTLGLCLEHAQKFDWNWAAVYLLSPEAQAAYDRAMAEAGAAYNRAMAKAFFNAWEMENKK